VYVGHRDELLNLIGKVRKAETPEELAQMQDTADRLLREALDCYDDGAIEEGDLSVIRLALEQFHHAIADRRVVLGAGETGLAWAYSFRIERMKREGAPVEWIETFDPIVVTISGIGLSAKATSPNAAKLLINFATSKRGQEMVREMRRIPARGDVKPFAPKMDQSKLKLKAVPKEVYSGLDDHAREFRKIFGL